MTKKRFLPFVGLWIPIAVGIWFAMGSGSPDTVKTPSPSPSATFTPTATPVPSVSILDESRITKKEFGLYATPENSPVQPERFSGYHVGADFETTLDEADKDIVVPALCDGKLVSKRSATGYGGVAVQACALDGQAVTVVYGHVKLSSVTASVGDELKKGDVVGILGRGFSSETDGERKHLHLGIHKGSAIDIRGYVSKQSEISGWLDPADHLK